MPKNNILAIVPAFNEASSISAVVKSLLALPLGVDVLVVNDGSADSTARLASEAGARVATLPCNLGIGGAVQTGLIYAKNEGYQIAMQVDGDGQHKADEVTLIVDPVRNNETDVVIGSRFLTNEGFRSSGMRRLGILIFRVAIYLLTKQVITDNTSGFRAYNAKAISYLADHYPCDYPEVEVVVALKKNRFQIKEVPVQMLERQGGQSSITPIKSVYYMIKVLLAVLISFLRPPEKRAEEPR
jgi:glycosyltransferase involved in cell wall biosynthesis